MLAAFAFMSKLAAQEASEKPFRGLEISGAVDAYYEYNFNEVPFPTSFTGSQNSISLGMANVIFAKEGKKVGFKADLAFGPRAEVANGYTGTTLAAIKQLYITYAPIEKLTLTAGNFSTHVGYEVIDAPVNMNYSTSYMFSNGPFFHTGIKADYAATEQLGFMLGILDDTDSKFDLVKGKHIGGQVSYKGDNYGLFLNYLGGKKADDADGKLFDNQVDLTATFQATDALGLGLNATTKMFRDTELDESYNWSGAAIYANYKTSDRFTLALRGEYIADKDGIITSIADNSIMSVTLSGNINIGELRLIPEFRLDTSKEEGYFTDADGNAKTSSAGFLMGVVYSF